MISTGWYYMTTDQWRYDGAPGYSAMANPIKSAPGWRAGRYARRVQRGWMPRYPTLSV